MTYAELVEKARETYESEDTPHVVKAWLLANIIYPTDKSEDERSRKWILEYLYDGLRKSDEQFKPQFKSAIAWIEKQNKKLDPDKVIEWLVANIRDYEYFVEWFKKDFEL